MGTSGYPSDLKSGMEDTRPDAPESRCRQCAGAVASSSSAPARYSPSVRLQRAFVAGGVDRPHVDVVVSGPHPEAVPSRAALKVVAVDGALEVGVGIVGLEYESRHALGRALRGTLRKLDARGLAVHLRLPSG